MTNDEWADLVRELRAALAGLVAERDAECDMKNRVLGERNSLARDLAEAKAVLAEVEWSFLGDHVRFCPSCNRLRSAAHSPDCRLERALGRETR